MAVIIAQTAMLGSLGVSYVVACSRPGSDDDIGDGGVFAGVAKTLRDQCRAIDDLANLEGCFVFVQVADYGGRVGGMVQEYETDVIGLIPVSNVSARGRHTSQRRLTVR
jgi:hypothetical protein